MDLLTRLGQWRLAWSTNCPFTTASSRWHYFELTRTYPLFRAFVMYGILGKSVYCIEGLAILPPTSLHFTVPTRNAACDRQIQPVKSKSHCTSRTANFHPRSSKPLYIILSLETSCVGACVLQNTHHDKNRLARLRDLHHKAKLHRMGYE